MAVAQEFQRINPRVAFWQAYEPAVKCDLSCCALKCREGWVWVDPIGLAAMDALLAEAPPAAIVLTNGNHARASAALRERLDVPVIAHTDAGTELVADVTVDRWVTGEDALLFPELRVFRIHGAGPGEIALLLTPALARVNEAAGDTCPGNVLVLGDAVVNVAPVGFAFLPDKYCSDPRALRESVEKLLRFDFELLTFAHGAPLVTGPKDKLRLLFA
jgi:hypothetical protein